MPSARLIALDTDQHVGLQRDLLTGARRLGPMTIA
jgi:hypothetical protein